MKQINHDEQKVVSMLKFQGAHMFPVIKEVEAYWEGLRAGRLVPLRSEIDPREIRGALEHTFILEHTKLNEIRFRLAGNKLGDLLGMELRGMPAYALIAPECRENAGPGSVGPPTGALRPRAWWREARRTR